MRASTSARRRAAVSRASMIEPGSCPICGMALEQRTATLEEVEDVHLKEVVRRFWASVALSLPLVAAAVAEMMSLSSVSVIGNALRLRKVGL
jgi:hypothetical protein